MSADVVNGVRLKDAVSHWELAVKRVTDDVKRPRFLLVQMEMHSATHDASGAATTGPRRRCSSLRC